MRLIDADALHKFVEDNFKDHVPYEWAWVLTAIDAAPTIDAVPVVHGRWKRHKMSGSLTVYACSACGCDYVLNEYAYCLNCGAKMDTKEDPSVICN